MGISNIILKIYLPFGN